MLTRRSTGRWMECFISFVAATKSLNFGRSTCSTCWSHATLKRRPKVALTASDFAAFETLVKDASKRELECRPYLKHAEKLLIERTLRSTMQFHEVRSYAGDADVILAADVVTDTGEVERMAFLWELKAPQCF